MKPYGLIALGIAFLGFLAGSLDIHGTDEGVAAALLNPFFVVGLSLGTYWLARSARG